MTLSYCRCGRQLDREGRCPLDDASVLARLAALPPTDRVKARAAYARGEARLEMALTKLRPAFAVNPWSDWPSAWDLTQADLEAGEVAPK